MIILKQMAMFLYLILPPTSAGHLYQYELSDKFSALPSTREALSVMNSDENSPIIILTDPDCQLLGGHCIEWSNCDISINTDHNCLYPKICCLRKRITFQTCLEIGGDCIRPENCIGSMLNGTECKHPRVCCHIPNTKLNLQKCYNGDGVCLSQNRCSKIIPMNDECGYQEVCCFNKPTSTKCMERGGVCKPTSLCMGDVFNAYPCTTIGESCCFFRSPTHLDCENLGGVCTPDELCSGLVSARLACSNVEDSCCFSSSHMKVSECIVVGGVCTLVDNCKGVVMSSTKCPFPKICCMDLQKGKNDRSILGSLFGWFLPSSWYEPDSPQLANAPSCAAVGGRCKDINSDPCDGYITGDYYCENTDSCCLPTEVNDMVGGCSRVGGICLKAGRCRQKGTVVEHFPCPNSRLCCVPDDNESECQQAGGTCRRAATIINSDCGGSSGSSVSNLPCSNQGTKCCLKRRSCSNLGGRCIRRRRPCISPLTQGFCPMKSFCCRPRPKPVGAGAAGGSGGAALGGGGGVNFQSIYGKCRRRGGVCLTPSKCCGSGSNYFTCPFPYICCFQSCRDMAL